MKLSDTITDFVLTHTVDYLQDQTDRQAERLMRYRQRLLLAKRRLAMFRQSVASAEYRARQAKQTATPNDPKDAA